MLKMSLVKKFSILSFIVISTLGIILGYTFSEYFQNQILIVSAERTADTVKILISYSLRPEDFKGRLSDQRYEQLLTISQENVFSDEIKRIIIWNRQGRVIFSDRPELIGRTFSEEALIRSALKGKLMASLVDFKNQHDIDLGLDRTKDYVAINVPIVLKGSSEIQGVYEVYREAGTMQDSIRKGQQFGQFFIGISLLILYLSLYQIVKKASKTIEQQDKALNTLTGRLDATMKSQEQSHVGTIKALMGALDAKDRYTAGHCSRVTDYAMQLGHAMGLSEERLNTLEEASLFHDIGKIGVPEVILNKRDSLSNDEFEIIKKHSAIGADIIGSISAFKEHVRIVRHHHERWDGRGYPDQLGGDDIPVESRILAVADTFDAMTSDRPYRLKMPREKALTIIAECAGTQFDPEIAQKFLEII